MSTEKSKWTINMHDVDTGKSNSKEFDSYQAYLNYFKFLKNHYTIESESTTSWLLLERNQNDLFSQGEG